MHVYRQSLWLCCAVLLAGCYGMDPTGMIYNRSPFSHATQAAGNAHCAPLFNTGQFARLSDKIPVHPGEIPSRAMLSLNSAPDDEDIAAIRALESAERTCRQMRAAAGAPTSATEDILAARLSTLRFGLYRGDIPYAVYNYGMAQALKSHNQFLIAGEQAVQQGRKAGREKEMSALMLGQFMMLSSQLSAFDQTRAQPTAQRLPSWTCTQSSYPSGNTYVDCY